jgi:hypothetical protein
VAPLVAASWPAGPEVMGIVVGNLPAAFHNEVMQWMY